MKNITKRKKTIHQIIFTLLIALLTGCGGVTTKEEVKEDLQDANEAIQEAAEATENALESKRDYYREHRQEAIADLLKRNIEIEKRISELATTAEKSKNKNATASIQSAIVALYKEKGDLDKKTEAIKDREKDWSSSYDDIISSITRIEANLEKLSKNLEEN